MNEPLLDLSLTVAYRGHGAVLDDVRLTVARGEVAGLVGQSGSGKSTLALAILRLLDGRARVTGAVRFAGRDLMTLREGEMRSVRGREIGLVLQSPAAALNPALRLETQLAEAWRAHNRAPWKQQKAELRGMFETLGLPDDDAFLRRYPNQVSIGQAQRVLIAMAVLHRPALIIADEPTSALDAVTQAEVISLFGRLNRELGASILFISHDLLSVASLCQRVAILDRGRIVETAATAEIFERPRHPYTQKLVGALPRLAFGRQLASLAEGIGGQESHEVPDQAPVP